MDWRRFFFHGAIVAAEWEEEVDQKEEKNRQNQEHLQSSMLHHGCKGPAETKCSITGS